MSVLLDWLAGVRRLALLAVPLALMPAAVAAGPALLVDEASGEVLFADRPDHTWYPASLTKLMTAYVTFEAIKQGQVTLQTVVPLSEKARGQPATRVGLRQGIELNVEQALRGIILRSANDFSMALAELIGGSEEGFAEKMNAAAKRIGMTRSHFVNPHGLPEPAQVSTARDMAILARAIHKDFPERAEMFSTMSFVIHKGTFHSQNDLLRTLPGADGMKTGFTCGAGYNVVATATRDGQRMIAVVLGEQRREARSAKAAELLEHGFKTAAWKRLIGAPQIAKLEMDPPEVVPVYDMSRQTLTRTCGNRVPRRVARVVAQARPKAGGAGGVIVTGSTPVGSAPVAKAQAVVPSSAAAGGNR